MNRRIMIVLGVLLIAALACNLPISKANPTPAHPTATSSNKAPAPAPTDTVAPEEATATITAVEEPSPTTTNTEAASAPLPPTPTATQPAALNSSPVVLANLSGDPAQLTVVDPVTGKVNQSFTASGLIAASPVFVATDAIFYLDNTFKKVLWAGYDGSGGELKFMNPGGDIFYGFILPSPDGKMIAWAVIADQTNTSNHNKLFIANKDGSGKKVLADASSNPPVSWVPLAWSADGKWLYFARQPYGIGGYILFNGIIDVQRVPLAGGNAEIILPPMLMMGDAAVSPDGLTLAYIQTMVSQDGSQTTLTLNLLKNGTIKIHNMKLPSGYLQAGAITWAPDSQSLVLSLAVGDANKEAYSVMLVDASTLDNKLLLTKDKRLLEPVTWPVAESLWLKDTNSATYRMAMPNGDLTQVATDQIVLPTGFH